MKSSSCVLVVWLLNVFSLGRAQLYEGEACRLNDGSQGVCSSVAACPGALDAIVNGRQPTICSFVNQAPIVCCNRRGSGPSSRRTTPTTNTTTRRNRPKVTTTTTTTTTTTPRPPSMVDESTTAGRKCVEYARYVFWAVKSPTLSIFEETYNQTECAMIVQALIVGGVNAQPKEFPHMAALGYGATEDVVQWKCGGSLISERFVLTAAHCLSARGIGPVNWVRLGDLNLYTSDDDAEPVTIPVTERIRHEGYRPPAHYNDIALLKLDRDVTFSPYIRPACLNTVPGNPGGLPNATATGWGKLEWTEEVGSDNLMKVDLEIRDESRCNHTFRSLIRPNSKLKDGITPESMICAGDPRGQRDTCGGDSGGPLQIRLERPDPFCMYSVIGLVSFGAVACGLGDSPAVYTRVSHYIPWIEQHVWP